MTRILGVGVLLSLLVVSGCARLAADASRVTFQPIQISAPGVDAAEPVTAAAPDGGFYVAWVNHTAHHESDVMLARFSSEGIASDAPVRVNAEAGVATAWRGDPPSIAVSDQSVYVLWTGRVELNGNKGTDLYLRFHSHATKRHKRHKPFE